MASKCLIQIKLINGSDTNDLKYKWRTASNKDQELNSILLQIVVNQFLRQNQNKFSMTVLSL